MVSEKQKIYTLDATGKSLGRLASQIALILQGKDKSNYVPYRESQNVVVVKNVKKMKITGKKMEQKKYYSYSGYPGGLKEKVMKDIWQKNPAEVLKKAVYGMLPKNKLRTRMIKRLKFED